MTRKKKSFNYVSLFSGAGGLDIGLERAGLKPIALCEIESAFCETLKINSQFVHSDGLSYLKGAKILNTDIHDVTGKDLAGSRKVDLVVGGPPCQSFSSSGKQRSVLDPRGALLDEFYRLVDELKPKMFLFENVRGVVTARDAQGEPGGVIRDLLASFEKTGYSCRAGLLNSADYGSHQRRVRCFIVGTKRGRAPEFPEISHQRTPELFHSKWLSLGEFLENWGDTERDNYVFPTEALAEQLRDIPDGSGLKSMGKKEATRPGGHWGYRQGTFIADQSLPARTITGSASQDWIRRNGLLRRLTFEEIKLLQGFPLDWEVSGTKAQRFKQIGNAVPAIFGEQLGSMIVSYLEGYPKTKPVFLGMPSSFKGYIDYTKRDHERNKASRTVHKAFSQLPG